MNTFTVQVKSRDTLSHSNEWEGVYIWTILEAKSGDIQYFSINLMCSQSLIQIFFVQKPLKTHH